MRAALLVGLVAALTSACGAPLMKLPGGPGGPAPEASAALTEAVSTCRAISTITAEIRVNGSVGGRRMRGRLLAGLAAPASARLEAPAPFGQPAFIFVARGNDATLLLPRARRVLEHGPADAVLEAITGVSMNPSDLLMTVTGCGSDAATGGARNLGNGWMMIPGAKRLYLRRSRAGDPWRIVAVVQQDSAGMEWRAEYSEFLNGLPRTIRLASSDGRKFNLRLALSQVELNVPLEDAVFRVAIPSATDPITLEDLRDLGPLAEPASKSHGA
jgi:hypothetical protein